MSTRFRLATDADIDVYRLWFADPDLSRRLSPPTSEWVAHIHREGRALWSALGDDSSPVAVFQTEQEGDSVWFDCAIDPGRRGQGEMAAILRDFLAGPLATAPRLLADVEADNLASLALLRRAGFAELPGLGEPGFVRFELTRPVPGS